MTYPVSKQAWEVQQLCDTPKGKVWLNLWSTDLGETSIPLAFSTEEEATQEMNQSLEEALDELGVPLDESTYRVVPITVYDPAPKYPIGYAFKSRAMDLERNFLITDCFPSDTGWSYHLGLDMGLVHTPVPSPFGSVPIHTLGDRQYVNWATIREYEVRAMRTPEPGEPTLFTLTKGYGDFQEWWNTSLEWVNRGHATVFNEQERDTYARENVLHLSAYWERVK